MSDLEKAKWYFENRYKFAYSAQRKIVGDYINSLEIELEKTKTSNAILEKFFLFILEQINKGFIEINKDEEKAFLEKIK